MKSIILAIKPKYAEAILSGQKKYEFRKTHFPRDVRLALLYSSNRIERITGWFTIRERVEDSPDEIWHKYGEGGGITKEEFCQYYRDSD